MLQRGRKPHFAPMLQAVPPGIVQAMDARRASDALYQCVVQADAHVWSLVMSSVGEEKTAAWLAEDEPFWRMASVKQLWALLDGLARRGSYGVLATVAGRACGNPDCELHESTTVARLALLAVRLAPDACVSVHTALGLSPREAAGVVKAAVADARHPLLPASGPRVRDAQFLAGCSAVLVATLGEVCVCVWLSCPRPPNLLPSPFHSAFSTMPSSCCFVQPARMRMG